MNQQSSVLSTLSMFSISQTDIDIESLKIADFALVLLCR